MGNPNDAQHIKELESLIIRFLKQRDAPQRGSQQQAAWDYEKLIIEMKRAVDYDNLIATGHKR